MLMVLAGMIASNAAAYTTMGKVDTLDKADHNITFNCKNGKVRVSFLTDTLVRVHMVPQGSEFPADDLHPDENGPYFVVKYDWPGVKYSIEEEFDPDLEGDIFKISAGKLVLKVRKNPFKIAFFDSDNNAITMEKQGIVNAGLGYENNKVYETMQMEQDEHFFGFGAYNNPLDVRGVEMICSATELENKKRNGGFPTPFFYSSRGYGIFFNNLDDDVTFRMGTVAEDEYSFEGTSGKKEGWDMDYYFIWGPAFGDILNTYTQITGRPILPEKWIFGHMQSKCCKWFQKEVLDIARKYREGDWPCDVIIIDFQAIDENFKLDSKFSDPKAMYAQLEVMGFMGTLSTALFRDIYDWTKYDPTDEKICEDYFSKHVPLLENGNDLWWQDNSERSEMYTGMKHYKNGYETHQLFGSLWAKNVVEGMEAMGIYGRAVISRGGPIGGHRYIIPWPGDTPFGVEFLGIDLNFIRGGSIAGYSSITFDSGGFINRGKQDPLDEYNVIRRVINIVPVVPVSRAHGSGGAHSAILPWEMTKSQQDLYRFYLKLRYRLHPYYYSAAIEASQTGRPILAPIVFDYQDDVTTYTKDYEFMLGRNILVAPVLDKSVEWKVYLPKGTWIHYWSGKEYKGGQTITVEAPLYGKDGLPMFVKAGAIIPMIPQMSYIYEKAPEPVTLDVYPVKGGASSYVMYDCKSLKPPLKIKETKFTCKEVGGNIDISISPSSVAYELWVHNGFEPALVTVDSKVVPKLGSKDEYDKASSGWYYGTGSFYGSDSIKTVNVKVPKNAKEHIIRIEER
jgi:alpha-glucosidase